MGYVMKLKDSFRPPKATILAVRVLPNPGINFKTITCIN